MEFDNAASLMSAALVVVTSIRVMRTKLMDLWLIGIWQ
jgi:hypothetical protein